MRASKLVVSIIALAPAYLQPAPLRRPELSRSSIKIILDRAPTSFTYHRGTFTTGGDSR